MCKIVVVLKYFFFFYFNVSKIHKAIKIQNILLQLKIGKFQVLNAFRQLGQALLILHHDSVILKFGTQCT